MIISGAQDFLPDFECTSALNTTCTTIPRYQPLANAMKKTEEWIENARVSLVAPFYINQD